MDPNVSNNWLHRTHHWLAARTCSCFCHLQSALRLAIWLCLRTYGVHYVVRRCWYWYGIGRLTLLSNHVVVPSIQLLFFETSNQHEYSVWLYSSLAICVWDAVFTIRNEMRFEQAMCHSQVHLLHNHLCNYLLLRSTHRDSACDVSDSTSIRFCNWGLWQVHGLVLKCLFTLLSGPNIPVVRPKFGQRCHHRVQRLQDDIDYQRTRHWLQHA
jgi:hypothetical protein